MAGAKTEWFILSRELTMKALFWTLTGLAAILWAGLAQGQPRLVVEPDSLAALFDYVGPDGSEYAENLFLRLRNDGDEDLRIDSVTCDVDQLEIARFPDSIEPGQQALISFNTFNPELGHYEGTVTIFSNDPDHPQLEIPATFDVIRSYRIFSFPSTFELTMYSGEIVRFSLVLNDNVEEQIGYISEVNYEFVGIMPPEGVVGDSITITIDANDLDGGVYEIELVFHADRQDVLSGVFIIVLFIEEASDIDITWPDSAGYPNLIDLNFPQGDERTIFPLRFLNVGSLDLEVDRISFENHLFSVNLGNFVLGVDEDRQVELRFWTDLPGVFEDTMTVMSNDPDEWELKIPVYLAVGLWVDSDNSRLAPCTLHFAPPFPNPFNSNTKITFSFAAINSGKQTLAIYDIQGRLVADLSGGLGGTPYAAGKHKVVWEATGLPSAIYFLRLESPNQFLSQKVVLMR